MDLLLHTTLFLALAALSLLYLWLRKRFSYWSDRGVPHEQPVFFYGNMRGVGRTIPLRRPLRDCYERFKGRAPFAGFYLSLRPAALLLDLDLVKSVLIKDFANFSLRGNFYNEADDPLSGHLFNLDGPKWKRLRAKLTPTFTSGKMRFMQPTVVEVAQRFVEVLGELVDRSNPEEKEATEPADTQRASETSDGIEIKELLARFTTDVIGTCAFGLECNSLRDPDTRFREMGRKAFSERRHRGLAFSLIQAFPQLARRLGVRMVPDDVAAFFMRVVRDTVEYREREGVQRNDFMNLLLELRRQDRRDEVLTLEEVAAQVFVFFLAGFETSSSTMSFGLYELAVQPALQERARAEVAATLERHGGVLNYEALHELKFVLQIVHETLRKYSIAAMVVRKTIADYRVPDSDHVIEAGTMVIIPVDAIHHDPEIYPQPQLFDPDRFAPSEVEKRHSMAWLPFGEGPRNCIGLRFGEMQTVIGLALLLQNFRFSVGPQTQIPLEIDPKQFILSSKGGIVLRVERV